MKVEIFNHEDDGFQIIYVDGIFFTAIHFNDDQFGYAVKDLIECLGNTCEWSLHEDIPDEYLPFLIENRYIDESGFID